MKKLCSIEWIKTWNYVPFRVIILLHFVLFFLVVLLLSRVQISIPGFSTRSLFSFPHIWETFSWIASWFNLLLAILMIVLAGNEFSYGTYRQQVMNGLSRMELLQGKARVILWIALYAVGLVLISSLIFGLIYTRDLTFGLMIENMQRLLVYFVQTTAYMALALLITLIIRNNAVSILGFIFYFALIEPVLRRFFPKEARSYFPVRVISHLTPVPRVLSITADESLMNNAGDNQMDLTVIGIGSPELPQWLSLSLAVVYIVLFIVCSGLVLNKRNL